LHDPALLDILVRLAQNDGDPRPRTLDALVRDYLSKGPPPAGVTAPNENDDLSTLALVHQAIRKQARSIADAFNRASGDIRADARKAFGLLTEAIQVKKAIALAQVTRNGMHLDLDSLARVVVPLRTELLRAAQQAHSICPVYCINRAVELYPGQAFCPIRPLW
jgi:hypothetical protein